MKRKDTYQDIYDKIRAEADMPLPEALSPEAVRKLVADAKPLPKPNRVTRYLAVAAVFLFVALAGVVGWRFMGRTAIVEPPQEANPTRAEEKSDDYLRSAASYSEIETFFLARWEEYRDQYRANSFHWGFNKSESAVIEDFAAMNEGLSTDSALSGAPTGSASTASKPTESADSSAHGQTNTQVAGIDESDILKNDGSYLYIVRSAYSDASYVDIVGIRDPKNMQSASRITLPAKNADGAYQSINELYVLQDTLVVLSSVYASEQFNDTFRGAVCYAYAYGAQKTMVQVYDITDRTKPSLRFSYAVDGALLSSRMNGSVLLLMTNYDVPIYKDKTDLKNACVPCYYTGTQKLRFPLDAVKLIAGAETNTYLTVSLLDVQKDSAAPTVKAVLGGGSDVYCNSDTLLVAHEEYTTQPVTASDSLNSVADIARLSTATRLFAFSLTDRIVYKGSAGIEGSVLNQFSMDAYNGYYRIATTDEKGCRITVLDEALETVSTLTGLAKGEQIYAVRFMGDTAYMVTFFQTDPLFVLDLHDPKSPTVAGELKIPGFSNYLHPYSDTLLIGIGQDGNESGSTNQLKISLFDVSDRQSPKEISKIVYGNWSYYSYSTAQHDHKAYLSLPESGEFAIPVSEYSVKTRNYVSLLTVEDNALRVVQNYAVAQGDISRATYVGDTLFVLTENQLTALDKSTGDMLSVLKDAAFSVDDPQID